jgi:hypothetical protein
MAVVGGDTSERYVPGKVHALVVWDPCIGLGPIAVDEPWFFLRGQVLAAAISLGLLGMLVIASLF